jgi:hypothetical protein
MNQIDVDEGEPLPIKQSPRARTGISYVHPSQHHHHQQHQHHQQQHPSHSYLAFPSAATSRGAAEMSVASTSTSVNVAKEATSELEHADASRNFSSSGETAIGVVGGLSSGTASIASLATPMSLPDADESDDDDDDEFTLSTSPMTMQAAQHRAHFLPYLAQPQHQLHKSPLRQRGYHGSAGASPVVKTCPPTPSPVRMLARVPRSETEFRRPRANVFGVGVTTAGVAAAAAADSVVASLDDDAPNSSDETAIADRLAAEQLLAAGSSASVRLFYSDGPAGKQPPPSPRYRAPPRSPVPMRRRAMSQAQPVLVNPFSPDRRRHTVETLTLTRQAQDVAALVAAHDARQSSSSSPTDPQQQQQHLASSPPDESATATTAAAAVTTATSTAALAPLSHSGDAPLSRYASDFTEIGVLGRGVSSVVFKASNNTDGWTYAIKVKHGGAHGVSKQSLNEMFALAALGSHVNVIRYYNAWIEQPRLYLQCEFCSGGSVQQRVNAGAVFSEAELCTLFRQMASALVHIHAHNLVHLDVKPDNMFIAAGGPAPVVEAGASMYKLGDLGLINAASDKESFEDGDSRYLPCELLNADSTASAVDLPRADVFSLGASIYELARRQPLPSRDLEWHEIRRLDIARPPHISQALFDVLLSVLQPEVALRPTASELLQHRLLLSQAQRDIEDLTARVRHLENQLTAQQSAVCL